MNDLIKILRGSEQVTAAAAAEEILHTRQEAERVSPNLLPKTVNIFVVIGDDLDAVSFRSLLRDALLRISTFETVPMSTPYDDVCIYGLSPTGTLPTFVVNVIPSGCHPRLVRGTTTARVLLTCSELGIWMPSELTRALSYTTQGYSSALNQGSA